MLARAFERDGREGGNHAEVADGVHVGDLVRLKVSNLRERREVSKTGQNC